MFWVPFIILYRLIRALPELLLTLFKTLPRIQIAIRHHGPLIGFIIIWFLVSAFAAVVVVMALATAWATISSLFPMIVVALLVMGCAFGLLKALLWFRGRSGGGQS